MELHTNQSNPVQTFKNTDPIQPNPLQPNPLQPNPLQPNPLQTPSNPTRSLTGGSGVNWHGSPGVRLPERWFVPNTQGCTGHPLAHLREYIFFNGIFIVLQLSVVILPTELSQYILKSQIRTLWGCHRGVHTLWHLGFLVPIPIVGIIWYYFLHWTHYTGGHDETDGQLVAYYRKHCVWWLDPFANLLPGLAQMFMTVYFTFLFSTIYGLSVKAALVCVIMVPILLFLSRGLSLWFARAASERHSKLLVKCKSKKEVDAVLDHWLIRQLPEQQ